MASCKNLCLLFQEGGWKVHGFLILKWHLSFYDIFQKYFYSPLPIVFTTSIVTRLNVINSHLKTMLKSAFSESSFTGFSSLFQLTIYCSIDLNGLVKHLMQYAMLAVLSNHNESGKAWWFFSLQRKRHFHWHSHQWLIILFLFFSLYECKPFNECTSETSV